MDFHLVSYFTRIIKGTKKVDTIFKQNLFQKNSADFFFENEFAVFEGFLTAFDKRNEKTKVFKPKIAWILT